MITGSLGLAGAKSVVVSSGTSSSASWRGGEDSCMVGRGGRGGKAAAKSYSRGGCGLGGVISRSSSASSLGGSGLGGGHAYNPSTRKSREVGGEGAGGRGGMSLSEAGESVAGETLSTAGEAVCDVTLSISGVTYFVTLSMTGETVCDLILSMSGETVCDASLYLAGETVCDVILSTGGEAVSGVTLSMADETDCRSAILSRGRSKEYRDLTSREVGLEGGGTLPLSNGGERE